MNGLEAVGIAIGGLLVAVVIYRTYEALLGRRGKQLKQAPPRKIDPIE